MKKASVGDGIPVELIQILKDDVVKVLHSICQQIWKTQQWPQDWKKSIFIPIPKKGNAKEFSNYHTAALTSHNSKVMLKIVQARLHFSKPKHDFMSPSQTVHEPWTSRCSSWIQKRQRNQRSIFQHPLDHQKSKRVPEKHLFLFYWLAKYFDCVDHNRLWNILKEMEIPDHLTSSWEICVQVRK